VETAHELRRAEVFDAFEAHMRVPSLEPGGIVVVLDHVGAHRPARILQRTMDAGAIVLFPAAILTRPQPHPDRQDVEQAEGIAPHRGGADARHARCGQV
jgi:hypothetical protein